MITSLRLDEIIVDAEFQTRDAIRPEIVRRYAEILPELPPIDVFTIEGQNYLVAGHHRLDAARERDDEQIPVTLHTGTREEALRFALTSNARHGLPLTTAEDRRVILRLAALYGFQSQGGKIGGVIRLQPHGIAARIAHEMSHSIPAVDAVLRASLVADAVPLARAVPIILNQSKLERISHAPEETWEPLARAAYHGGWDDRETTNRVRDVNAGKPLDEVIDRPTPEYRPPSAPPPDPEHDRLEDYMELSRAIGRFAPYLTVGRYDWRDVPRDEGNVMLMQLGMMRVQIERVMAFLMGQGYEPQAPTEEERQLIEV